MSDTPHLRSAHGSARDGGSVTMVEATPIDEMQSGMPADARPVADRDEHGRLVAGPGTAQAAQAAAIARWDAVRFATAVAEQLGMVTVGDDLRPYIETARATMATIMAELSAKVGGGRLDMLPATYLEAGARADAVARYLYSQGSQTGDLDLLREARHQSVASRQHYLAARDLAARDATSRPRQTEADRVWQAHQRDRS